jgi:hypothetical protein
VLNCLMEITRCQKAFRPPDIVLAEQEVQMIVTPLLPPVTEMDIERVIAEVRWRTESAIFHVRPLTCLTLLFPMLTACC